MGDLPEWIFETRDYEGTPVVLSRATWQAKAGNAQPGTHPEVLDYLEDIRVAVESPDLVFQSTRDERSRIFYQLGMGRVNFAGKHLVVVIKYIQEATGQRGYIERVAKLGAENKALMADRGVKSWHFNLFSLHF